MSKPVDVLAPLRNLGRWDYSQVYDSIDEDDGPSEWVALDDLRAAVAQVERAIRARLMALPFASVTVLRPDGAHSCPITVNGGALVFFTDALEALAGPPGGPKEGA